MKYSQIKALLKWQFDLHYDITYRYEKYPEDDNFRECWLHLKREYHRPLTHEECGCYNEDRLWWAEHHLRKEKFNYERIYKEGFNSYYKEMKQTVRDIIKILELK